MAKCYVKTFDSGGLPGKLFTYSNNASDTVSTAPAAVQNVEGFCRANEYVVTDNEGGHYVEVPT